MRCFKPLQIFNSFENLKGKVGAFSIEWGFRATNYNLENYLRKSKKTSRSSIKYNCQ